MKTLVITQTKDTPIRGLVRGAFAEVEFTFYSTDGGEVTVVLDIESSITILEKMDNGAAPAHRLKSWWKRLWR